MKQIEINTLDLEKIAEESGKIFERLLEELASLDLEEIAEESAESLDTLTNGKPQ